MERVISFSLMFFCCLSVSYNTMAQEESPYRLDTKKDLAAITLGLAGSGVGFYFLKQEGEGEINDQTFDPEKVQQLTPEDVPSYDRYATRHYDTKAFDASWTLFYASAAAPFTLLADKHIRADAGKVGVIYLEVLAATAMAYTFTAGLTSKKRPLVYNPDLSMETRTEPSNRNSFYNGHTSLVTSTTFFMAKVYHDYHPETGAWIWGAAALPGIAQGYLRMKAGKHFLSDTVVGYGVGALIGIGIPQLHKIKKDSGVSLYPAGNGFLMTYSF